MKITPAYRVGEWFTIKGCNSFGLCRVESFSVQRIKDLSYILYTVSSSEDTKKGVDAEYHVVEELMERIEGENQDLLSALDSVGLI